MPETKKLVQRQSLDLASAEVQELIKYRPNWAIRHGNLLFFSIFCALLLLSWSLKFPETLNGSMKLVAINAPTVMIAKMDGKLKKLLVANEQEVYQGQPIAFLQSTASHEQVFNLLTWIKQAEPIIGNPDSLEVLLKRPMPASNELGELQAAYQDFQNAIEGTLQVLRNGYYQQEKNVFEQDLSFLSGLQDNMQRQKELMQQDYELQNIEYNANQSLANQKVIAPVELNQNKSKLIGKDQGIEQMRAQIMNGNLALLNKRKEILELQKAIVDQYQKFKSAFFNLKSKVQDWMQVYVIIAVEGGKVLFTSFLQENQTIQNGQELFYIQPVQSQYYGQLMVSQKGLGKIKIGQKVLVRVESYPSAEFGFLRGHIIFISAVPTPRDSFLIKVDFPDGLKTNSNKSIYFRNNLSAQAEVITDDRRLIQRLFRQLLR